MDWNANLINLVSIIFTSFMIEMEWIEMQI